MGKLTPENQKQVKALTVKLKQLQEQLALAKKLDGDDTHLEVTLASGHTRFSRVSVETGPDKGFGHFTLTLAITTKSDPLYIPLSVASGIRAAGFMYQIEGTVAGAIKTADVTCRGVGVTHVTIGTLLYAKVPAGTTAMFDLELVIRGQVAQTYKIVINRINYKLNLADTRYRQYLKTFESNSLRFA